MHRVNDERVALLGPPSGPTLLAETLRELAGEGPVAMIRAGWQEWESERGPVGDALGRRAVPLALYDRAERVWSADPDLLEAHHRLQRRVRRLRRAYNVRLSALMDVWRELERLDEGETEDVLLGPEVEATLDTIRELDAHQCARIAEWRAEFADELRPARRPALARELDEIAALLEPTAVVVVDGGHVAVLLNRIRLFGLEEVLRRKVLIGISGGAMALTERLVLFHDSPPWGPGHAEVAEAGLGFAPGVAVFPHAERRLRLGDPSRMSRLARRLAPARCFLLDEDARLTWNGRTWSGNARRLTSSGIVQSEVAA